jgi:SpoVK/Ycf46/Vps4 family AAA+-type ATPase
MEDFKGIMIATTNMVGNFDTAFERRFIYKIKFNIPSVQVRTEIWKEKLPILNNNEALTLAENFNLSGSQIENIAKKCELKFILEDVKTDIHLLEKLASQECFYNINRENRIGYKVVA